MRPIVPLPQTSSSLTQSLRRTIGRKVLVLAFVLAFAMLLLQSPIGSKAGRGKPNAAGELPQNMPLASDGSRVGKTRKVTVDYQGEAAAALKSGTARPITLATGDFNQDGAPDLVTGYAGSGGIIAIQFGNVDAYAPSSPEAYKALLDGKSPATFAKKAITFSLPSQPDFLLVNDFDSNGTKDVIAASREGWLYMLPGDGSGHLGETQSINLGGRVTAIDAGEFNKGDGKPDLVVGLVTANGPAVHVYQGLQGGLGNQPLTYSLPEEASFVGLGKFDGDNFSDLVATAGNHVVIVHGQTWKQAGKSGDSADRRETIDTSFRVRSATLGEFVADRDARPEIALLADDGTTHMMQRNDLDTRPLTEPEIEAMREGRPNPEKANLANIAWENRGGQEWQVTPDLDARVTASGTTKPLSRVKVFGQPTDGLLAIDSSLQELKIVPALTGATKGSEASLSAGPVRPARSLAAGSQPIAVLEIPRKLSGEQELVVLNADSTDPSIIVVLVATSITVDRIDDPDPTTADNCINATANDCSLRGATQFANLAANAPATINIPAGTYTLTRSNAPPNTANEGASSTGDLDLTAASDGAIIVGAGQASTIIRWDPSFPRGSVSGTRDRILELNPTAVSNWQFTMSGVTMTGGDRMTFGIFPSGGAIIAGGSLNSTTISNSTFDDNDAESNGGAITDSFDAATHPLLLTGCTFTNNTAGAIGGGVNYLGASGITFSGHNSFTTNTAGQGGGIGTGDSTGTANNTFPKLTVTGNTATADGGGIVLGSGNINLSFSRIVNNVAPNPGTTGTTGLLRFGGAVGTATAEKNWWGCNTNPTAAGADAAGCDTVKIGSGGPTTLPDVDPWLFLRHTASPNSILLNGTSTLTASFLNDSNNVAVGVGNLDRLIGLPIVFNNAQKGSLSAIQTTIQASGTATATFTAGSTSADCGDGGADAKVDNQTVMAAVHMRCPEFTLSKANNVGGAAVVGQSWTWTLTVTNNGDASGSFTAGQTIVTDNLPNSANISYTVNTPSIVLSAPNSGTVSCSIDVNKNLSCTAAAGGVTIGTGAGATFNIQITAVSATVSVAPHYQNPRSGGIDRVDPNDNVVESNETNNNAALNTVTVTKASTTTTITNTGTPGLTDTTVVGQPYTVTWSVTVNSPGNGPPAGATLTGNVTVSDGTVSCFADVSVGQCSLASSTAGAKSITATYAGDGNYNGSVDNTGNPHTVNKADTTTTITNTGTPGLADATVTGQSYTVTWSVTVNPPGAGPTAGAALTGNVTVSDGTVSCFAAVSAGQCSLASSTAGAKNLTATYAGDSNYNGSVDNTGNSHTVNPADTTTTITNTGTPGLADATVVGQPYTVTWSVTVNPPGSGPAAGVALTGNVTVSDGTNTCFAAVNIGQCSLTSSTAGLKAITATYAGDSNYNTSVDNVGNPHTVNPANTTTTITNTGTPGLADATVVGQPYTVTWSVTVNPPGAGPAAGAALTGNVTVSDGTVSCFADVSVGQCSLASSTAGAKAITATYAGDSNYNGSVDNTGNPHTVNQAATTTTITNTASPGLADNSQVNAPYVVQWNVAVNAPGSGPAAGATLTGNVTVSDGTDTCFADVSVGQCSLTSTTAGLKSIVATYAGDSNYLGDASPGDPHTVVAGITLVVNLTTDVVDANPEDGICDTDSGMAGDQCTLREAIRESNFASSVDTITFDPILNTQTILLDGANGALPDISDSVKIIGPGANLLTVQRDSAAPEFRIFHINGGKTVEISGLTLKGGLLNTGVLLAASGGGILNEGALTLTDSAVNFNFSLNGGGVYNVGNLLISGSTFHGNTTAGEGGGVNSEGGLLTVVNTTISGNHAATDGGGLLNCGTSTASLINVTITGNHADSNGDATGNGGGLAQISSNLLTMSNTIVAGNDRGNPIITPDDIFVFGAPGIDTTNSFNNLIGDAATAGAFTNNVNGNRVGNAGVGTVDINTILNTALTNNGGPTSTHALVPNSPAIDNGTNTPVTSPPFPNLTPIPDQRGVGFPRIVDGNGDTTATVDIGAYEAGPDTTAPTVVSIDDGDADNVVPVNTTLTYTITFNEDIDGSTVTAADFTNGAGSSPATITIGIITKTSSAGNPAVFTVQVTPTTGGNIVLSVGPAIADLAGNVMTGPALDDDTVRSDTPPTLGTYMNQTVVFGENRTVTPSAAPADDQPGLVVTVDVSAGFTGGASVNSTSGDVDLTNSGPVAVAAYTVTVRANDGINPEVTSTFQLTVNKANTSTNLQSSSNPSSINQQVTFTATITATSPGAGTPTGTVDFLDGATVICDDAPLVSGVATCLHTFTVLGPHSITTTYAGDASFNGSGGGPLIQTVNNISISGKKFNDSDGDGVLDAGEPGLPVWTIELYNDVNTNGLYDPGTDTLQTSQPTDANGLYSFSGFPQGKYVVREVLQAGWVQTAPAAPGTHAVDATGGGAFPNRDFGNFQLISISGRKFNDLNGNGNDNGGTDPGLNGFTIQLYNDINNNGIFESGTDTLNTSTVTANIGGQDGRYIFNNIGPGKYIVREVIPPEYIQTQPISPGSYAVTAASGVNVTGRDFGNFRLTTTTTVSSNLNPSFFTDPVTFTATVTANPPGSGTPTGTVTFLDGATPICSNVPLNGSGQASCLTSSLTAGSHAISAQYNGDLNFATSAGTLPTQQVNPKADVGITKSDSPDPVVVGTNLTYTITVTNNGPSTATNVVMTDNLPGGVTFGSATPSQGSCSGSGPVTCNLGSLVSGAQATVTIVVGIPLNTPHNTVLTNNASVTRTEADLVGGNDSASQQTTVVSLPDLTISKTHVGNFAGGQNGATYTLKVNNVEAGPTNGSTVTVTDTLPIGLTPTGPNGVSNGWNCSINGKTLTCTRSDVLAGNSSYPDIVLTVNVINPAPLNVINSATVSGGGEVNTANNTAVDPTNIQCTQNFALNNVGQLMISRFRSNGPNGAQDEFVEIHNPLGTPHTVASGNCGGGGYGIYASAGNGTGSNNVNLVCYIPNGSVIPAYGYYLCSGVTSSLANLGANGGAAGATSTGDAPIGCNGSCTNNIPTDAGLALMNVAGPVTSTPAGFDGGVPSGGFIVYDKLGFSPYGAGAPAPAYPSLAGNFCEGGFCILPAGDASTQATCVPPTANFPVIAAAPACFGQSGQYEYMRRQTPFHAQIGTQHQDSGISGLDFIFLSPNPAVDTGKNITGLTGLKAVLGTASPHNTQAPTDAPPDGAVMKLPRTPFDGGNQLGPRNAERIYSPDPVVADLANNPLGTFALRYRYVNNSGVPLTGLRFGVDNLSTICGPQAALVTGTGDAANAQSVPNCGTGTFTAILKVLNSASEVMVDSGGNVRVVNGLVIEDLSVGGAPGSGPLAPQGGALDTSLVINPSAAATSLGNGVTGGTGNFGTTVNNGQELNVKIRFGVVRSGRFILLLAPMAKPAP